MRKREVPVVWSLEVPEGLKSYQEKGYQIREAFYDPNEIVLAREKAIELRETLKGGNPGDHLVYEQDNETIRAIYGVQLLQPKLVSILVTPELVELAETILGPGVYIHQCRINYKSANTGDGYFWHSDFTIWRWEDGLMEPRCASFMIPLDEVRPENGPLQVAAGSHLHYDDLGWESEVQDGENKYLEYSRDVSGRCRSTTDQIAMLESLSIETILGKPGDLFCFDSNILHTSKPNTSPWDRSVVFVVINSMHNKLQDSPNGRPPRSKWGTNREYKKL